MSLLTGVVFGVVPAWISSHGDPIEALRGSNRTAAKGASFSQKLLVVCQAALSLVLIAGAICSRKACESWSSNTSASKSIPCTAP